MTVKITVSLFKPQKLSSIKVLDTCCGTGGFLVSYVNHIRDIIEKQENNKGGSLGEIRQRVSDRVKELCSQNVFGLDINPFLVRTCQMNLVMHGDGSANIYQADSVQSPGEWQRAAEKVALGKFDIVFTNPPFGGKANIDDPHILSRYELTAYASTNSRSFLPAEQLFVEAALKFVKPGGFLAIVLPDSILNNPGLRFIRDWTLRRSRIVASIDLPKETFAASGGVPNPSVLIVQRFTKEEVKLAEAGALDDYDVFMSIPRTAGRDKRGNPKILMTPEGDAIYDEEQQPIVDDDLPLVVRAFAGWKQGKSYGTA